MVQRSLAEAAEAMDGQLQGAAPGAFFAGASLDSRTLRPGQLFFALPGEKADGHRFVASSLAAGAAAAVVHQPVEGLAEGASLIRVSDTFQALHDLTRHVRSQVPEHLAGITGSAGKTTTKEILAALLARRYRTARSPGNLNNLYGFPLSLLGIPDDSQWMVAEMGMSTPGELAQVSLLARPDVVLLINVKPVHLEFFPDLAAIADAKAEILQGLDPEGLLVANAGDPQVTRIVRRHLERGFRGRVVGFALEGREEGFEPLAYRVEGLAATGSGSRFRLVEQNERGEERSVEVSLPLLGRHNAENFLAAAAVAASCGVPLEEIAAVASELSPAAHRGVVHALAGGTTVLDDSYNSNPYALSRALEAAAALPARRRWAVLGDMLELGPEAPSFHFESGREAGRLGFSPILAVGELAKELARGARSEGAEAVALTDAGEAAERAVAELRPGDLVLVKGSRGIALEQVVEALLTAREEGKN